MAYPNMNNKCLFEGRCTAGTFNEGYINTQNGQILKIQFSISVPRSGVSNNNNNNGQQQKTNDFVTLVATGPKAEFIKKWFAPGRAIKVETVYREWQTTDQAGNKKYGHNFEVVDASFVCSDAQNAAQQGMWNTGNNNGGNNGNNNGGGYQQNNNGYQNNQNNGGMNNNGGQQPQNNNGPAMNPPQQNNQQSDFNMFNDDDMPF